MVGVILAGGRNSRFPYPKGFITLGGERIIDTILALLKSVTGRVVISTNSPELYYSLGVPLVGDVVEPSGPISGILSAFAATGADAVLVMACDMPFVQKKLLDYIISRRGGEGAVPLWGGRPEPLLAIYERSACGAMERRLREGLRSMSGLLGDLDIRYINDEELSPMDSEGRSFVNINTVEDYALYVSNKEAPSMAPKGGT